jgi:site-specific DNA-methyltransferase (adenine-specific)
MLKLMQGDCLELMQTIPDKSIDMILCDLPYGTTACKWDSVIPFEPLWAQYRRIAKPNAAIVLFGSEPFSSALRMSNIKQYKYDWIWHKTRPTGFAQAKNQPMRDYENIIVFSEGTAIHACQSKNRMTYNPQGLVPCSIIKKQGKNGRTDTCFSKRVSHKELHLQNKTGYPRQVLSFASESKTVHPTQKPVALLEYLVYTYTNDGETVLDNCMGSGSTGVACMNTNRRFIGIELDENYYHISKKRIEEALHVVGK